MLDSHRIETPTSHLCVSQGLNNLGTNFVSRRTTLRGPLIKVPSKLHRCLLIQAQADTTQNDPSQHLYVRWDDCEQLRAVNQNDKPIDQQFATLRSAMRSAVLDRLNFLASSRQQPTVICSRGANTRAPGHLGPSVNRGNVLELVAWPGGFPLRTAEIRCLHRWELSRASQGNEDRVSISSTGLETPSRGLIWKRMRKDICTSFHNRH